MLRRPRTNPVWLMLLALGGLLAGHLASYFLVAPDAHARAELLAATGHAEGSLFATVSVAASFAAVIGIFVQRLGARRERGLLQVSRPRLVALLWAVQTAGFVGLEAWERGHGFAGVPELANEPAFLVGLVAQLAVALVATMLVCLVRATAEALLRLLFPPPATDARPLFSATSGHRAGASVARAAWNLRGPPAPAGSCN